MSQRVEWLTDDRKHNFVDRSNAVAKEICVHLLLPYANLDPKFMWLAAKIQSVMFSIDEESRAAALVAEGQGDEPKEEPTFLDAVKWLLKQGALTGVGDRAPTGVALAELMIEQLKLPYKVSMIRSKMSEHTFFDDPQAPELAKQNAREAAAPSLHGPFTEQERAVISDLAKRLDISEHKVLVQGLRTYQLIVMGAYKLEEIDPELRNTAAAPSLHKESDYICSKCGRPIPENVPCPYCSGIKVVLKCQFCGHYAEEGEYVGITGCSKCNPTSFTLAALHKEEVNMLRDPRDKQESGAHRADSEQTSAFDARAWLAKEYPDWIADVKPYELELIERAYNSGRAALP